MSFSPAALGARAAADAASDQQGADPGRGAVQAVLPPVLPGTPTLLVDPGLPDAAAAALDCEATELANLMRSMDAGEEAVSEVSEEPGTPPRALFGRSRAAAADEPPTVLCIAGVGDVVCGGGGLGGEGGLDARCGRVAVADLGAYVLRMSSGDMAEVLQVGAHRAPTPVELGELCPMLREVAGATLEELAAAAEVLQTLPAQTVLRAGEAPQRVAVVMQGTFAAVCRPPLGMARPSVGAEWGGAPHADRELRVGEVREFGVAAAMSGTEVWADFVSEGEGTVVLLPARPFRGMAVPPAVVAAEMAARETAVALHAAALATNGLAGGDLDPGFAAVLAEVAGGRLTADAAVVSSGVFPPRPAAGSAPASRSSATPPSQQSSETRRWLVTPTTTLSTEPSGMAVAVTVPPPPPSAAAPPAEHMFEQGLAEGGQGAGVAAAPTRALGFKQSAMRMADDLAAARPALPKQALQYLAECAGGEGGKQYSPAPEHAMRALARMQRWYAAARDAAEGRFAGIVAEEEAGNVAGAVAGGDGDGGSLRELAAAEADRLARVSVRLAVPRGAGRAPPAARRAHGAPPALHGAPPPVLMPPAASRWDIAERAAASARSPDVCIHDAAPDEMPAAAARRAAAAAAAAEADVGSQDLLDGAGSLGWAGVLKATKVCRAQTRRVRLSSRPYPPAYLRVPVQFTMTKREWDSALAGVVC